MSNYLKILIRNHVHTNIKAAAEIFSQKRTIACTQNLLFKAETNPGGVGGSAKANAKKKAAVKITLLGANNSISVTSLEEAQKLSKRRDLNLVKVQDLDTKTQRPVYKLITAVELLNEDQSKIASADEGKSQSKRVEKLLTIGSRISDHDLSSRLKNITKWLSKQNEVRVLLQGSSDDIQSSEKIFSKIEETIKDPTVIGKIVQKRPKGGNIKFNIIPADKSSGGKGS